MRIHLKTLTPLWTGGVDQGCDRLHETGLIGSLRWWYEALVRGLGGYACDPTSEDRCGYDPKKPDPPEKQLCAACYLFGCTGWARKFRLQLSNGRKLFDGKNFLIPSGRVHQSQHRSRAGGWFVFSESLTGEIGLEMIPLGDVNIDPIETILVLISRHASIGAKSSNGYGVIQCDDLQPSLDWLDGLSFPSSARNNALPDLRDFFFARYKFNEPTGKPNWWRAISGIRQAFTGELDDNTSPPPLRPAEKEIKQVVEHGILPIAPAIRNWLRYEWKHGFGPAESSYIFGEARAVCPNCYSPEIREDKKDKYFYWCPKCRRTFKKGEEIPTTASKINVSYAYRSHNGEWQFRIWGWLPCGGKIKRDEFLNLLQDTLNKDKDIWQTVFGDSSIIPQLIEWHSLDCQQTDGREFLQELLG